MTVGADTALHCAGQSEPSAGAAVSRARNLAAIAAAAAAIAIAIGGLYVISPPWAVESASVFVALAAIVLLGYLSRFVFGRKVAFDGAIAVELIALAVFGLLPALAIGLAYECFYWAATRRPLANALSNLASALWGILAAAGFLALAVGLPPDLASLYTYEAMLVAGAIYLTINYAVVTLLVDVVLRGERDPLWLVQQEFVPAIPVQLAVVAFATLTLFSYHLVGIPALALFALIVYIPQLMLPRLLVAKPMTKMSRGEAAKVVGLAIAQKLGVEPRIAAEVRWRALALDEKRQKKAHRRLVAIERERERAIQRLKEDRAYQEELAYYDDLFRRLESEVPSWSVRWNMRNLYEEDLAEFKARHEAKAQKIRGEATRAHEILKVAQDWADLVQRDGLSNERAIHSMRAPKEHPIYDPDVLLAAAELVEEQRIAEDHLGPEARTSDLFAQLRASIRRFAPTAPKPESLIRHCSPYDLTELFLDQIADQIRPPHEIDRKVAELSACLLEDQKHYAPERGQESKGPREELHFTLGYYRRAIEQDQKVQERERIFHAVSDEKTRLIAFAPQADDMTMRRLWADKTLRRLEPRYRLSDDPEAKLYGPILQALELLYERYDGQGPLGLKGDQIPLTARLLSISYHLGVKYGWTKDIHKCLELLRKERGHRFDPTLCDAATEIFEQELQALSGQGRPRFHKLCRPPLRARAARWITEAAGQGGEGV